MSRCILQLLRPVEQKLTLQSRLAAAAGNGRRVEWVSEAQHREPGTVNRPKSALAAILACGMPLAATAPAVAVDLDELTVVTLARDGSWGVATAASQGPAIAAAISDCRAMAGAPSDCGAQFVTSRGGWVIANLCGDHPIIVGADTRQEAEAAAAKREIEVRRVYVPDLPPCRRVLTVDPAGAVAATG